MPTSPLAPPLLPLLLAVTVDAVGNSQFGLGPSLRRFNLAASHRLCSSSVSPRSFKLQQTASTSIAFPCCTLFPSLFFFSGFAAGSTIRGFYISSRLHSPSPFVSTPASSLQGPKSALLKHDSHRTAAYSNHPVSQPLDCRADSVRRHLLARLGNFLCLFVLLPRLGLNFTFPSFPSTTPAPVALALNELIEFCANSAHAGRPCHKPRDRRRLDNRRALPVNHSSSSSANRENGQRDCTSLRHYRVQNLILRIMGRKQDAPFAVSFASIQDLHA